MKRSNRNALLAIPAAILAALLVAWAGSQGGAAWLGIPTFLSVVTIACVQLDWEQQRGKYANRSSDDHLGVLECWGYGGR